MFTAEYFSERGMAGAVDFRAVPADQSRIEINTLFARDRKGQDGQSVRILTQTGFGDEYRGVADMNLVSSFVFRQVFEEGFDVISSPIEHSRAFLTRKRPGSSFNFIYNRSATFFTNQPAAVLLKFPSFEASLHTRPLGQWPVYFHLNGSLSGFSRRDAVLKTPSFVERFDIWPSLEIPVVRSGAFEWSHRIGLRHTIYSHSRKPKVEQNALHRLALDYGFRFVGPRLERDFGDVRHVLEPTLEYRYVGGVDRFRDTLIVDNVDLLTRTNEVVYGITSRLFKGQEILSWTIRQKYFIDPTFGGALIRGRRNVFEPLLDLTGFAFAEGERRFSPIVSTIRISPSRGRTTDIQVDYDTEQNQFRSAGIIGGFARDPGFFNLAYFFTRRTSIQDPNNQLRATVGYGGELRHGLSAAFSFAYDIERAFFQASVTQVGYNTDCYGLSLEFMQFDVGARKESRIRFSFSLKDIGSYGTIRRQERLF